MQKLMILSENVGATVWSAAMNAGPALVGFVRALRRGDDIAWYAFGVGVVVMLGMTSLALAVTALQQ